MIITRFTKDMHRYMMHILADGLTYTLSVFRLTSNTKRVLVQEQDFGSLDQAAEAMDHIYRWNTGLHINVPARYDYLHDQVLTRMSAYI